MAVQPRKATLETTLVQRYRTPNHWRQAQAAQQAGGFATTRLPLLAHLQRRFTLDRTTVAGAWVAMPYALHGVMPTQAPAATPARWVSTPGADESFGLTARRGMARRATGQPKSTAAPRPVAAATPAATAGQPPSNSRQTLATPAPVIARSLASGGQHVGAAHALGGQPPAHLAPNSATNPAHTDFVAPVVQMPVITPATVTTQSRWAPAAATVAGHVQRTLQEQDKPVQRVTIPGAPSAPTSIGATAGVVGQAQTPAPTPPQAQPRPLVQPTGKTRGDRAQTFSRRHTLMRIFAPRRATPLPHAGSRPAQVSSTPGGSTQPGTAGQPTAASVTTATMTPATVAHRTATAASVVAPAGAITGASGESTPSQVVAPLPRQTSAVQPAVDDGPLPLAQPAAAVAQRTVSPEGPASGPAPTGTTTIAGTPIIRADAAMSSAGRGLRTTLVDKHPASATLTGDAPVVIRRAMNPPTDSATREARLPTHPRGAMPTAPGRPQSTATNSSQPTAIDLARMSAQRTARQQRPLTLPVAAQRAVALAQAVNHPPTVAPLQREPAAPGDGVSTMVVAARPTEPIAPGGEQHQAPVVLSSPDAAASITVAPGTAVQRVVDTSVARRVINSSSAQRVVGDNGAPASVVGRPGTLPVVAPIAWPAPPEQSTLRQPMSLPALSAASTPMGGRWAATGVNPVANGGDLSALPYVQRSREPGQPVSSTSNPAWPSAGPHSLAQRAVMADADHHRGPTTPLSATGAGFDSAATMSADRTGAGGSTGALDLERLADEVYAILDRRMTIERESLGL